jgi:RNA polymerase sigma-70 factor (ECF subfamily)
VAETVARAWRARETLESEAAFRAWIFRILNNTFISDLRRTNARPRLESMACEDADEDAGGVSIFEELHQPFLFWFGNPEQEFLDKPLREDLDRALATLPECYSVVVILSDLQGFSYAEIAEMLEIPIGTVRSRLARARAALQGESSGNRRRRMAPQAPAPPRGSATIPNPRRGARTRRSGPLTSAKAA